MTNIQQHGHAAAGIGLYRAHGAQAPEHLGSGSGHTHVGLRCSGQLLKVLFLLLNFFLNNKVRSKHFIDRLNHLKI